MKKFAMLAAILLLSLPAFGDAIDDAEAKKRGVSVETVQLEKAQARIKELEKEIAELKHQATSKPSTTKTATATKTQTLTEALTAVPSNMRPKAGESQRSEAERADWAKANLAGKRVTVQLTMKVEKELGLIGYVSNPPAWLKPIVAVDPQKDQPKFYEDDVITVEGTIAVAELSSNISVIGLSDCTVKIVKAAK